MRDYFAALAARTLQPELGVQPRHRVRWEDVPEPSADAFAPMSREAIARDAPSNERSEEERLPRSNRRSNVSKARPQGEELLAARSERDHAVRKRSTDHDETKLEASAAMPRPAVRTAPAVQIRSDGVEAGSGHVPAIRRPGIADGRAPAAAARGIDRALHVPTRLSARDRERAASEPAIRIHIGRVDVRAVTAAVPGPPAPRESKRALMSLDEYVQKRERGAS